LIFKNVLLQRGEKMITINVNKEERKQFLYIKKQYDARMKALKAQSKKEWIKEQKAAQDWP
jgi:hypothetical protein